MQYYEKCSQCEDGWWQCPSVRPQAVNGFEKAWCRTCDGSGNVPTKEAKELVEFLCEQGFVQRGDKL